VFYAAITSVHITSSGRSQFVSSSAPPSEILVSSLLVTTTQWTRVETCQLSQWQASALRIWKTKTF